MADDRKLNRRKITRRYFIGGMAVAGALAFDQGRNEINRVEVVQRSISLPRWTAGSVRIAYLTDWHLNDVPATRRVKQALRVVLDYRPDFILFGGDYISSLRPWRILWIGETLEVLKDYRGVVAGVYGNHDYQGRDEILGTFRDTRAHLLANEVLRRDGIEILGLDDAITGFPKLEMASEMQRKDNQILLLHEPDYAAPLVPQASLTLCGHTHGGQICLPGGFPLHLPRGGRKYVAGEFSFDDTPMYVSRGLGTSGPAYRAFCRPEITILDLNGR
jgi:predicted MPP superfamily phosphohydrolase